MQQTQEFDPSLGGFAPGSPEAYQLDESRQDEANSTHGLNPEISEVKPEAEAKPVAAPKAPQEDIRNQKIAFVKDAPLGDLSLTPEQLLVKEKLAKQPKYSFYIPLEPGEKKGTVRPVIINTYRCEVPKGMQVQLPESIYRLLVQAYDAEAEVLNSHENNLANADSEKRSALGI